MCVQGKYYTYADVQKRVAGIGAQIAKHGERIGVIIDDSVETYAAIIAILLAGKTYIPLHPGHPADRIALILEQGDISVACMAGQDIAAEGLQRIHTAGCQWQGDMPATGISSLADKNAYILFTSGSTGTPKGTPISYSHLDAFVQAFHALGYNISEEDRYLQMFELTFDLSVMSYLIPLCTGACVYTVPEKGMKYTNIYGILEAYQITFALMVPSILAYLRPYFEEIDLPALRYSLFCGEALHEDIVHEWMRCAPNAAMENVYGPTEATIFCTRYSIPRKGNIVSANGIVCIGLPMAGVNTLVTDEDGIATTRGELCLSGQQVTNGYLDAEKTKAAFFTHDDERYYRTGDIVQLLDDGNHLYCGRADHQVKIQGFRVELGEIEHHARSAYQCNAVAVVHTTERGLSQIHIVLEHTPLDSEDVIGMLRTKLPHYMVPAFVQYMPSFPLNVNGKTDRKAIAQMIREGVWA